MSKTQTQKDMLDALLSYRAKLDEVIVKLGGSPAPTAPARKERAKADPKKAAKRLRFVQEVIRPHGAHKARNRQFMAEVREGKYPTLAAAKAAAEAVGITWNDGWVAAVTRTGMCK